MYRILGLTIGLLCFAYSLQATIPNINNINNCIYDVRKVALNPPSVPTFDSYTNDYHGLLFDLQQTLPQLPYVYQEAAAKPLIAFLENLGENYYLYIFNKKATDDYAAVLQQIIPDAVLAILEYETTVSVGIKAFQEVVSDLYDAFLGNESRVSKQTGQPIEPPNYGVIPPLVKFGDQDTGPYTWPADATSQILGMECGIVSLPPSQISGGLIAWTTLGHETGGHDVTHSDKGLLDELAQKVYSAVFQAYGSRSLANYWARCIDEASADVCSYLNMGPTAAVALIGYFRALGDSKLRTVGSLEDPHPIDLLRGYLGAAVVKNLNFKDAATWSQFIFNETKKDNGPLYLVDQYGIWYRFPVSFETVVASSNVVAEVIMKAKLFSLQEHSLQDLEDWNDEDQAIVDHLEVVFKNRGDLPINLQGPEFYAAHVIAGATQAGLQKGTDLYKTFKRMKNFLVTMHEQNPTWSKNATKESVALLKHKWKGSDAHQGKHIARYDIPSDPFVAVR